MFDIATNQWVFADGSRVGQDAVLNAPRRERGAMRHIEVLERQEREEAERHAAIDAAVKGWTPTADHVVLATVRQLDRQTASGIIAPGDVTLGTKSERRGRLGRIVAAGPDAVLAVGRRVYAPTYAGAVIDVDGQSLLIIRETELLMVLDQPDADVQPVA